MDSADPNADLFTPLASGYDPAWSSYPTVPEPFLELPFGYSCQHDEYWNYFGGATNAEFRRALSYNRDARLSFPLDCARAGRITSFFDHQDPLYTGERSGNQIPTTVSTYEGARQADGSGRNPRDYSGHPAWDFRTHAGNSTDTPVLAAAGGIVSAATSGGDAGNYVDLRHPLPGGQVYFTRYFHLANDHWFQDMKARVGDEIQAGVRVGTMDSTGRSTGPHLHFEVQWQIGTSRVVVDPTGFLTSAEFPIDEWTRARPEGGGNPSLLAESYYLWVHPLLVSKWLEPGQPADLTLPSGDVHVDIMAGAVPWTGIGSLLAAPDPRPLSSLAGAGHAFWLRVRSHTGIYLDQLLVDAPVQVTYTPDEVSDLVPGSLALYRWDGTNWQPLPEGWDSASTATFGANGTNQVSANLSQTGLYALLGTPAEDLVAPRTIITLTGTLVPPGSYYTGTVTLEASASDEGGSGLARTEYSLDHGDTWQLYTAPLLFEPPYHLDVWIRSLDGIANVEFPAQGATIWYEGDRPHSVYLPVIMRDE